MNDRHPFYVFYDDKDFVTCFGTARELGNDGLFRNEKSVMEKASKIKQGVIRGYVITLKEPKAEKCVYCGRKSTNYMCDTCRGKRKVLKEMRLRKRSV